ncbi:MAG: hypothetical protein JSS62_03790 [Verrucomicrobia bacterium]|nr:hypothetical protein [Verrucomicrobiota bacterium]MBS0645120.1 hypothetical protein [Verrucomicrobiota bacterium]
MNIHSHTQFNATSVPPISRETLHLLKNTGFFPPYLPALKWQAENVEKNRLRIHAAQQHPTRRKLLAFLATCLALLVIGSGGGLSYYCFRYATQPGFSLLAPFVIAITFLATLFFAFKYTAVWGDAKHGQFPLKLAVALLLAPPLIGPCIPMIMEFSKLKRYEQLERKQMAELEANLQTAKKFFHDHRLDLNRLLDAQSDPAMTSACAELRHWQQWLSHI